jgi:hypothetical protein
MGLFDRGKIQVVDLGVLNAIMNGADEATYVSENASSNIPFGFRLEQNYPNPFNPSTIIKFSIPAVKTTQQVVFTTLTVYDILGRQIATLVNGYKSPGNYEIKFDASGLPSGVYIYKLDAGTFHDAKKLLLLK